MQTETIIMAQEAVNDWWEVEALYDLCFAPGRTALSSYRLRDEIEPIAPLCLTARDGEGILAGAIRYWPVKVGGAPVALLGPVAVHPTRQGEGLAAMLLHRSLASARKRDWDRVLLVGDLPYYGRFGFAQIEGVEMPPPTKPDRLLALSLRTGAWDSVRGDVEKWTD